MTKKQEIKKLEERRDDAMVMFATSLQMKEGNKVNLLDIKKWLDRLIMFEELIIETKEQ